MISRAWSRGPDSAARRRKITARRWRQGLGLAGIVLGLAPALTACGGSGSSGTPLSTVVSSAKRTLAGAASTTTTFTGARLFGATETPVTARGEFDFLSGVGYEAVHLDRLQSRPWTDYLLFLPQVFYLQPTPAHGAPPLPAGKLVIRAALAGPHSADRTRPGFIGQAEALGPQLPLSELAWGAVSSSPGSTEVIEHVPYTRYDVVVSLARALSAASGGSATALLEAIADELTALHTAGSGRDTLNVRVWVDGPGRVVRVRAALPGSGLGTATTTLGGFGEKVPRSVPKASETVDAGSLRGSLWTLGSSAPGG